MTIESFNLLDEHQKTQLVFDADKISEKADAEANYQLFRIDNFFVETKTSLEGKFKRSFRFYTLKELPAEYASEILSIPIVTLKSKKDENASINIVFKTRKALFARSN